MTTVIHHTAPLTLALIVFFTLLLFGNMSNYRCEINFDSILVACSWINAYTCGHFIVSGVVYQFFLNGVTITRLSSSPEGCQCSQFFLNYLLIYFQHKDLKIFRGGACFLLQFNGCRAEGWALKFRTVNRNICLSLQK